jgi:hypothetical protein
MTAIGRVILSLEHEACGNEPHIAEPYAPGEADSRPGGRYDGLGDVSYGSPVLVDADERELLRVG